MTATEQTLRAGREGVVAPATFAQEQLWVVGQLEADPATYNIPLSVRLSGKLDLAALEAALDEIVRRHEALRTTFAFEAEQLLQVVRLPFQVALPVVDLRAVEASAREAEVENRLFAAGSKPFDLGAGPLLRTQLLRVGDDEHVFQIVVHHIVWDAWSRGVFFRELSALYRAFLEGRESPLPELAEQYADHARRQRAALGVGELTCQLAYWKAQLAGVEPVLDLPTDYARSEERVSRDATHTFAISPRTTRALRQLARGRRASLFMVALAAFQVLLGRRAGRDDFIVGVPTAGRVRPDLEGLIGLFVNTLALRADLGGDPSFSELVDRVRETSLDAYSHQDAPFRRVVEAVNPPREAGRNPLAQVAFTLEADVRAEIDLPGIRTGGAAFHYRGSAKTDLSLSCYTRDDGITARFGYPEDLYEEATIERMGEQFSTLLDAVAADSSQRLSKLPILPEHERQRLLVEWGPTWRPMRDRCVHELFEDQVARSPDALALVFRDERLTYRELGHRADVLAERLRVVGVGPEVPVILFVQPSIELVVGLLGILKAGGAYVPLDPAAPAKRLEFVLADTGGPILTQERLLDRIDTPSASVITFEGGSPAAASPSARRATTRLHPRSTAYVIYTSGSSGLPKGVVVEHRSITDFVEWIRSAYPLTTADVMLARTSFAFDACFVELLWPLVSGAAVVVAPAEAYADPQQIADEIEREGVTAAFFVPSMLAVFLEVEGLSRCRGLRYVGTGGEALPREVKDEVLRAAPDVALINFYGPTEITVAATHHRCAADEGTVPIGRATAGAKLYVLDRWGQPSPIGVPGEIHVGGRGVARGYLGRAGLTADRFIPDPFEDVAGARLYRTGDRGRFSPDGKLEFLGRLDDQVKVGGYRIEPGEIEHALLQHPRVRAALVVAQEIAPRSRRLVAYVVADTDVEAVSADVAIGRRKRPRQSGFERTLRDSLRDRLPQYMLPAAFVVVDALPLTPAGKVDRSALPAPRLTPAGSAGAAPRGPLEKELLAIWIDVLSRAGTHAAGDEAPTIGIHDNFFYRGGHSLLAAQILARIDERFGVELPLAAFFESPTVAGLSELLAPRLESADVAEDA